MNEPLESKYKIEQKNIHFHWKENENRENSRTKRYLKLFWVGIQCPIRKYAGKWTGLITILFYFIFLLNLDFF